ncbi:DedA family protein [Streptomyces indicus]|uniref:Membrane protein DedA, SNARE-associated domain n=1 Tax=Streptomyces indicus TaxID=417292 RepID=A0A1G9A922_9ACTN|nr:DedA family protein [Streptomyces indicus]SDK23334.1 membrane protein DedA, SNARE-associated domain [Streptomyces indicus]
MQEWLASVPASAVYLLVAGVLLVESVGVPLPGGLILVTAALLGSRYGEIDPWLLAASAALGAACGAFCGLALGRRAGRPLLERLGRRFPRRLGPARLAAAERSFGAWGPWAVLFGRFVALLRIFTGPVAGTLRMPLWQFAPANTFGAALWAGVTTGVVHHLGLAASRWLTRFSALVLAGAVLLTVTAVWFLRRRARRGPAPGPAAPDPGAAPAPD